MIISTFRANCYSAHLSWALVLTWVTLSSKTKAAFTLPQKLARLNRAGLGPDLAHLSGTVYIARFKCRAGLDPDRAYLFLLGSAHQKVAPGRARSTRLHCQLFCRAVLDPGRALSICGCVNVAIDCNLGWEENGLSCYDFCAEGALLPSITAKARVKNWTIGFAMFLLGELNLK